MTYRDYNQILLIVENVSGPLKNCPNYWFYDGALNPIFW